MKKVVFLLISIMFFYSAATQAQTNVLIPYGSVWKYEDRGMNLGNDWRLPSLNDITWKTGNAPFGYGLPGITTTIKSGPSGQRIITSYYRKTIILNAPYSSYKLKVKRDDGVIVYINNTPVYKNNLPEGEVSFITTASKDITTDTETSEIVLPTNLIAVGSNTISVEVHQSRRTSPDLLFDLELIAAGNVVVPPGSTCGVPLSNTAAAITENAATITWNPVQGATSYELQWRNSSTNSWTTISNASSPYTITGLSSGQVVVARIRSICNNIPGNYSAEVWFITKGTGTTCLTPPNVNSTNITTTGATINWGAVGGAVSYNLQWKSSGASTWTTISNLTTTNYVINGLTAGTSYDVQIQAVCSNGSGSFSVPVSFTTQTAGVSCGVPTNLNAASITQTSANLTWAAVTGATSYTLQWRTVGSSNWTTVSNLTATSYSLSGLTAGNNYEFQVRAVCGNTSGNDATPFSFSTAVPGTCGNPANLTLGVVGQTTAELRWGAVGGAVSYNLEWQSAGSSTWSLISNITTNSYTLTGLTAGTAYNFRVQAVCSGTTSAFSQTKDFITTNPSVTCNAPTGLSAGNLLQTSAVLSWSPVTGATAYNLEWKSTASSSWTTVANISTNSYTLTGLSPNTTYEFIVQSICSGGTTSAFATPPVSFTTTGSTCGVASLSTSAITQNSATLGWTAVQFATGYNLQWKPVSATSWTTVSNLPTNPTTYNLTGLTADTDYEFRVQTICSSGSTGVYSASTNFKTSPSVATGPANEVIYIWSGALQPTSAVVNAKLTTASANNRLVVSTSQNLSNPIYSAMVPVSATTNMMVRLPITGLTPNTTYYYAVESNGIVDNSPEDMGKFKTPEQCGFSYKFTTGSCSRSGNHQVYAAMTNHDPLFTLITGDFHYADANSTNVTSHRTPYETSILSQGPSAAHFRNVPIAYTWDDHDYCGNNSGGAMTGRASARQAYREYIPHYPLAAGSGNQPIQQAFTIGRLHYILADTRSERASGTMLGAAQNAWFKQQCLYARDNNLMIVFISGVLWHGDIADNWEGYAQERDALANWFRDNNIKNMFIITGDAHMLGVDDGGNQDFSTGTNNPNKYPHFCSSGINVGNNPCVAIWNTWCTGNVSGSGQYALIDVTDNGGADITITFRGYRTNGNNATNPALLRTWSFTRTLGTQICNPPATTCGIPTNLATASITQTGATLNWSAVTGATAYNLQWKTAAATTWTTVSNLTATSYNLTGLIASTQYNFQVQAVCGNTTGTYSAPNNFTTTTAQATCGTPGGLSATAITATGATLNWIAVSGATSYNLQWKTAAATTWTTVSNLTATSYNLTGLAASTQYNFQVQAVCGNTTGNYTSASNFTTTSAPVSCGTPSGLTSANITQTSADLSWTAVSGATSYNLQWKTAAATTWTTLSSITTTTYNLTGLAASTQYSFQVQAICGNNTGTYSSSSNFTTASAPVSCGTPSGLTSANITQTSAALSWTAVSGATSYNLQWKTAAATTWTTVSSITTTTYNLTGLTAATPYNFQVQAVCGNTTGSYSAASNFTTGSAPAGPPNEVVYMWSGALQPTTATVVAKMTTASTTCRAVVSTSQTLTNPIYSSFASAATTNNLMAKMNITGLTPNTVYYYAIESNGIVDNSADDIGRFQTSGTGAYSFKFTVGSCSKTGNHSVYTLMANKNPLFFLSPGDLHYDDPNSTNVNTHRLPYETHILSPTPSRNFFKNHGIAYTWDDHDYCGNNNTVGQQTGTQSARQAYQEYIPHYPLASGTGNVPINQAFTIGRVHFIMPDLRSTRAQSSGTMFGTASLAWFKEQCLYARNNNLMIAWVSSTSFGGVNTDNWGGYTSERTSLSNWFRDNNIKNMFIMSGDAHMLAIDNGTNHDFSTGSNNPNDYPVFAAAAINNAGSTKGGTYSQGGTFPNPGSSNGQYGLVEVTDNGGCTITIKFTGYRNSSATSTTETQVNTYTFTRTLCAVPGRVGSFMNLSLRSFDEGTKVQLNWNSSVSGESYVIERSSDKRKYVPLTQTESASGSIIDDKAETGWNYYRAKNSRGVMLEEKQIFIAGKSKIKLIPNPASGSVKVQLRHVSEDVPDARYIIYTTQMKTVKTGNVFVKKGMNAIPLDISGLAQGIYYVHMVLNGVELHEKLIVE